jgi:hypothetical protein
VTTCSRDAGRGAPIANFAVRIPRIRHFVREGKPVNVVKIHR